MAEENDEAFVERVFGHIKLRTKDFVRLKVLARRGAEAGKLLAEQHYEYTRKTNALITRHAAQMALLRGDPLPSPPALGEPEHE